MPRRPRSHDSGLLIVLALALAGCSDLGVKVRLQAHGEVSSAALDFGTLAVNDLATRTVTVRNTGNASLAGDATITTCPEFQLTTGGGPFTLAPGATLDIVVRFQTAAAGNFSCTLDLGPACPQVALLGSGALQPPGAAWSVVPTALDFLTVPAGQSVFRSFKIISTGTAPLTVNVVSGCGEYLPVTGGGPAVIPPADSVIVNVLFNPLSGGPFPCSIAVGPGIPSVTVTGFATTVSFAADIQPIFNSNCISCHPPNNGMNLNAGVSYNNLVNVTSFGYPPAKRIVPFDLANSVLYAKIANTGQFGPRMPQGPFPLPQTLIDKVKAWILEGARNN